MEAREKRKNEIDDLCEKHGCKPESAKRHFDLYVNKQWNPHPPERFIKWWRKHPDYSQGIDAVRAFNCQCYRDAYSEAKTVGAT